MSDLQERELAHRLMPEYVMAGCGGENPGGLGQKGVPGFVNNSFVVDRPS